MSTIEVQHLRLRGPPANSSTAAFRIEDALRTEVNEDRLVLVRKIDIGRFPTSGRQRAVADLVGSAWQTVLRHALHGGSPSAASANCVWFRDGEEARHLLIARLATGQSADAWFWHLAVPGWHRQPLDIWVLRQVEDALVNEDRSALFGLVEALIAASATTILARALAQLSDLWLTATDIENLPRTATCDEELTRDAAAKSVGANGEFEEPLAASHCALAIATVIDKLPPALRILLGQLSERSSSDRAVMQMVGEAVVLRRLPELRLASSHLAEFAAEWVRQITNAAYHRTIVAMRERAQPAVAIPRSVKPQTIVPESAQSTRIVSRSPRQQHPDRTVASPSPLGEQEIPDVISRCSAHERYSPAAGLLLTIIPLIELGWREWLSDRPALIGTAPAARLIDAIAAHHRVPIDNPARQPWIIDDPRTEDWVRLWRVGLDRWLKRRTGIKLARLIWRPGWLTVGDQSLRVRFPLAAADIRLRRHALDRDPGWVDWLGLSVRYTYRDTPDVAGLV